MPTLGIYDIQIKRVGKMLAERIWNLVAFD
jgi:hypothetical protein